MTVRGRWNETSLMKSSSQYQEHSNWPTTLKGIDKKKKNIWRPIWQPSLKKKRRPSCIFIYFSICSTTELQSKSLQATIRGMKYIYGYILAASCWAPSYDLKMAALRRSIRLRCAEVYGGGRRTTKAVNLTRSTYFHCVSYGPLLVGVLTHQSGRGLSG